MKRFSSGIAQQKYETKKTQINAPLSYFRWFNLSLTSCSSAEPVSVSIELNKIHLFKLYLQPVEFPSHFQLHN
jgi:hypothetical protein